jgi:hypothetical protein
MDRSAERVCGAMGPTAFSGSAIHGRTWGIEGAGERTARPVSDLANRAAMVPAPHRCASRRPCRSFRRR